MKINNVCSHPLLLREYLVNKGDKKYPEHYNLDWGTINYEEMIKE